MIYELRTYRAAPGRMADVLARFRDHTIEIFERHGIRSVGYWTNLIGGRSDELVYLLEFDDLAARDAAWTAFLADEEWQAIRDRTNANGNIVAFIQNRVLAPTDFSKDSRGSTNS